MISNTYINEIISRAQRAAADYAYIISKESLSGENSEVLLKKLDVCLNVAANLQNSYSLTDHEKQIIIDKLIIRGDATNYSSSPVSFSNTFYSSNFSNLIGEVTSVGNVTTMVNDEVIKKKLTNYVKYPGIVLPTDSIIQAIQKIDGNYAGTPKPYLRLRSTGTDAHAWEFTVDDTGMLSLPAIDLGLLADNVYDFFNLVSTGTNAHKWKFTVDDTGMLSSEDLGV